MYDQIHLHIWRQKTGSAIIRTGVIIGTNTACDLGFDESTISWKFIRTLG